MAARKKEAVLEDAKRTLAGGPEAIARRQGDRLAELVRHARAQAPHYRRVLQGLPEEVRDVRAVPVLTKRALMEDFDGIVADPAVRLADVDRFVADKSLVGTLFQGKYVVWNTSGTTGLVAYFLHDLDAMTSYGAMAEGRGVPMWLTQPAMLKRFVDRGGRTAVLCATGGHFGGQGIVEFGRRSMPDPSVVQIFDVKMPLRELVDRLNKFQPGGLVGYTTAWYVLAQEQKAGRLRIEPAYLLSGAEWLAPEYRKEMEEAFGCPVFDVYAASECMGMAFDCGSGWLHVNADWCILEPVDERGELVRPGATSHTTLLTNLHNKVQPLLRYDIGDRLQRGYGPCACGNPLPTIKVEGRKDDILYLADPAGQAVPLMPKAIGAVIEESAGLGKYQLVQVERARLQVRVEPLPGVSKPEAWATVQERTRAYLDAQGLANVRVDLDPEPPGRDPKSGKFLHAWAVAGVKGWHLGR